MEIDQKRLFGKMLGEIYKMQKATPGFKDPSSDAVIYALTNGIESVIDSEINNIGWISKEQFDAVVGVLNRIWSDKEELQRFSGFYYIEDELKQNGVGRCEAAAILTYLNARNRFTEVIEKMDCGGSPTECRTFDLND